MTQNKKYLLRKIGKRVCHVAMTVSTFAVAVTTVVSADEVVAPTDNNVTTTTEAPATPVTATPTTAAPTSETPAANPVTDVAPATTVTGATEAPVTEAPTTATPVTEAPTTAAPVTKAEKSTNIDELLRPETNQSAQITVTTQLHKGREGNIDSAPTGEPKVEKVSTTRSNADARINAIVVDEVNKIQQSNNGNALVIDGENYRVSSYSVNKESRTVDGVQVLNYSVNVYTEYFEGNFDRRVHSYELTVADDTGASVEEKHQTETGVEGLNTKEIFDDQAKYALGGVVEHNGKSYRVIWNQQRTDKIDSIDSNPDEEYINYGMEVRLKEIAKFPTEIIMFQINDDKGNVLRGPRRAEIVAGRAESIFNIGDKIVEGGKNYVVAGRSMSHAKEDLPTGEVQTFLYKITLKEEVQNKPAQYVATVDYVVGGEIIKQAVVLNGSADNKDQADAQLNSQSNLMQAMLGKEFEMGGKKYKVKAVRDIQRENFDEDDKVRLSLKMVYDLEEVPAAEEPVEEYPRAEAPGTETEQPSEEAPKPSEDAKPSEEVKPSEDVKPSEEKPSEDVKPSEDAKPSEEAPKPSEEKPSENVKPSEEAPKPSEEKPSENAKPSEEAPKEDKKAPSSEVKQEKVAPKQEANQLPSTGVESLIGSLGAGLVAFLGGLGLAIKKDHNN